MMTVVYLDALILINFIANYLLLLGAGRVTGKTLKRGRIAIGAAVGALYAASSLLPWAVWFVRWPCKIAVGIFVVLLAYGKERGLLKVTVVFFAASAGLAGLTLAVGLFGGAALTLHSGVIYSDINIRVLFVLFILCYCVMSAFFRRTARHNARELVELNIATEKRTIKLTALIDSGHTLTDPMSNRPIIVADGSYFADELPEKMDLSRPMDCMKRCTSGGMSSVRLIPYRAVGVECGLLLAIRAASVRAGDRELGSLLVALSPTAVSDGGAYQALIGGI